MGDEIKITPEKEQQANLNQDKPVIEKMPVLFGLDDFSIILPLKQLLTPKSQKVMETMIKLLDFIEDKDMVETERVETVVEILKPLIIRKI